MIRLVMSTNKESQKFTQGPATKILFFCCASAHELD